MKLNTTSQLDGSIDLLFLEDFQKHEYTPPSMQYKEGITTPKDPSNFNSGFSIPWYIFIVFALLVIVYLIGLSWFIRCILRRLHKISRALEIVQQQATQNATATSAATNPTQSNGAPIQVIVMQPSSQSATIPPSPPPPPYHESQRTQQQNARLN